MSATDDFDLSAAELAAQDGEGLIVDVDGFEGPLHLLLALARKQKVDLLKISILKLADQYLGFVHQARRLNFSLAADYLVMAAWLTYLKSRLVLPKPEKLKEGEAEPADLAAALAFSLAKLDAMRKAVEALKGRPQLGREVFTRGDPQAVKVIPSTRIDGDLYALMGAFAEQMTRRDKRNYQPRAQQAFPLEDARDRLRDLLPEMSAWTLLSGVAPTRGEAEGEGPSRASYLASTLAASLELVKEGALEARQTDAFADVYIRTRAKARREAA
jgi:segregation and condensation protein A